MAKSAAQQRAHALQARIVEFSAQVCDIIDKLPSTRTGGHVAAQLVRCSTAAAPNYAEAQGAESRRDFVHKLRICLKELRETQAWLQFIRRTQLADEDETEAALSEADELIAIFVSSVMTAQRNDAS